MVSETFQLELDRESKIGSKTYSASSAGVSNWSQAFLICHFDYHGFNLTVILPTRLVEHVLSMFPVYSSF